MPNKENDKEKAKITPIDTEKLTPWQQENLKYLEQKGSEPEWQVPESEEESSEEKEQPTNDSENEESEKAELEVISGKKEEEPKQEEVTFKTVKDLPKSKSYADKLPKLSEERQKRLRRRLTFLVSVFGIVALGMLYYVSPLIRLDKIKIAGNEHVTKEAIAESSKLKADENIWKAYFSPTVEDNVKKANPRVKSVKVKLEGLNNLLFVVTEFQEVAYAKEGADFHPVLENGVIMPEKTEIANKSFPILLNFKKGEKLAELLTVYSEMPETVKANIQDIQDTATESNPHLININMKDGNKVIASTVDVLEKMQAYDDVVAELDENGVIDMEAGIFYYPFAKEKSEENE